MIDREILSCFLEEALDSLGQWERACLDLETNPSTDTFNVLFRAAHNLKGASRAVGLDDFGAFVHCIEDLITLLMKGTIQLNPALVGVLLSCQVELVAWIEELKIKPEAVPDIAKLRAKLEAVTKLPLEEIKLIAAELALEASGAAPVATEPVLTKSESAQPQATKPEDDLEALFQAAQAEYQAHQSAPEPASYPISATPTAARAEDTPGASQTNDPSAPRKPADPSPKPAAPASVTQSGGQPNASPKVDETIRVAATKIDELLQLIGELSIHQAIVEQARRTGRLDSRASLNAMQLSNKIVKDLYGKTLSLRMQPVQGLFQRLERTARDVARSQGKKIQVVLEGTDVELDKTVIERITDPLIHIVRNAVDHGIETAEDRKRTSKSEIATVRLSASQEPAGVCLKVAEDGRGLNRDKILKKAIEKGLISAAANLSPQQINNLIFMPNFSTADKVTDISGRGVGMDVVSKAVQALQGSIDLSTEIGKGTTFAIMLPTSLSIIEALIIKVNNLRYAIAMHELTEIIDLSEFTIESSGSKGRMFSLRGDIVPVQMLGETLRVPVVKRTPPQSPKEKNLRDQIEQERGRPALVVREGESLIAFEVEDILGQQQVVVRPLTEQLAALRGFTGSVILGDGEPGMIVSLAELAKDFMKSAGIRGARNEHEEARA